MSYKANGDFIELKEHFNDKIIEHWEVDNLLYTANGNVGIGTSTPTHTLDVVGEIHVTGNIVSFTTSDRKLKNNLAPIEDPLEKLKKINGYTF